MTDLDYQLFDVDNHFYEAPDAFSRYADPQHAVVGWKTVDGIRHVVIGDEPVKFFESHGKKPEGQEEWVGRPGSLKEMLRKLRSEDPSDPYLFEPVRDEFLDRDKRLALMDEQGVEACLMFPGTAVSVEMFFKDTADLYANFRAFNRWVEDDWGFAHQERIFAPAMLSLRDLDSAVAELERVIARGVRVVGLKPGPAYGRSPADPYFDPFWARINEAGLTVAFHLTESGYTRDVSSLWGEDGDPPNYEMSAWQWFNTYGDMPIMATITALIYGNLFGRFPNIRVAIVENGAGWVPYMVSMIDKMRGMGRNGPWIGGPLTERPSAIWRRHFVVTPYPEDDVAAIVAAVGPETIAMGSDYPHPEGLAEPRDFQKLVSHLPYDEQRMILRENGRRLVQR